MSHFTTIKTQIVEKEYLLKALDDLNLNYEQGDLEIRGYNGQKTKVEIKLPTKNPEYDLGFRKQGDSYELVADWYGIQDINQNSFVNDVSQRYAYNVTKDRLEEQDFTIVEEEVQQNKVIHLTVRRMV